MITVATLVPKLVLAAVEITMLPLKETLLESVDNPETLNTFKELVSVTFKFAVLATVPTVRNVLVINDPLTVVLPALTAPATFAVVLNTALPLTAIELLNEAVLNTARVPSVSIPVDVITVLTVALPTLI